ncbi:MAG: hypothetical protein JXA21_12990 [Anaerolineae bacterium]|nr:hypothetical protein [Anaerolineae bacterium]
MDTYGFEREWRILFLKPDANVLDIPIKMCYDNRGSVTIPVSLPERRNQVFPSDKRSKSANTQALAFPSPHFKTLTTRHRSRIFAMHSVARATTNSTFCGRIRLPKERISAGFGSFFHFRHDLPAITPVIIPNERRPHTQKSQKRFAQHTSVAD